MWKVTVFAALLCGFLTAGCQYFNPLGPAINIGLAWKQGEARKYYNAPAGTVAKAVRSALRDLDLVVSDDTTDAKGNVSIRAGTVAKAVRERRVLRPDVTAVEEKDRFKIHVEIVNSEVTRLAIRVNTFGDKPFAELIYSKVDRYPGVRQFASGEDLDAALSGTK